VAKKVTFLGESIHGVAEFTDYKRRWLERLRAEALAVVFEADHAGMMRSRQSGEPAEAVLANFPKIHRTREMRDLLTLVIESGFPFFGADVVVRNKEARFSGDLAVMRDRQITRQGEIYEREDWAEQRDAYMAGVTAQVCADFPDHHVVGLFHNMHIKKAGSQEFHHLRLTSVAEHLAKSHGIASHSIALFARAGEALDNDLTPFAFKILDQEAVELLANDDLLHVTDLAECGDRMGFHHAFEKENLPVARQYDECVIFPRATRPIPLG